MRLRGADGLGERGDVVWPVVAAAVDEERRRPGNPAEVRALDVLPMADQRTREDGLTGLSPWEKPGHDTGAIPDQEAHS